jgi:hypothetical protein
MPVIPNIRRELEEQRRLLGVFFHVPNDDLVSLLWIENVDDAPRGYELRRSRLRRSGGRLWVR